MIFPCVVDFTFVCFVTAFVITFVILVICDVYHEPVVVRLSLTPSQQRGFNVHTLVRGERDGDQVRYTTDVLVFVAGFLLK